MEYFTALIQWNCLFWLKRTDKHFDLMNSIKMVSGSVGKRGGRSDKLNIAFSSENQKIYIPT